MRHDQDRRQQTQALGAAGEEGDGCQLVEAMAVLRCAEHAAGRIWIMRPEFVRHEQVVADRQEVEARPLSRLGTAM